MSEGRGHLYRFLRWSEKYTKTDMVYLAKGGFWTGIGQSTAIALTFGLSIVFANYLDPVMYGNYRYVLSLAGILTLPTLSGLMTATTRAVAHGKDGVLIPNVRTRVTWGLLGGAASLATAAYYYSLSPMSPLAYCFLIAALFLPFMDSLSLFTAFLYGKKDFSRSVRYTIRNQIVATMAVMGAVIFTHNIFVITFAYFSSWTVMRYLALRATIREYRPPNVPDRETTTHGKHLSLINLFTSIVGYADRLIVFHYLGALNLAIYSFAVSPVEQLKGLAKNLPALALPKLSERSPHEIDRVLRYRLLLLGLSGGLLALAYILAAPYLFVHLFPKYLASVPLTQMYALGLAFVIPSQFLSTAFQSKPEFIRTMYVSSTTGNIVLLSLLFIFGYYWGMMGIVLARTVQYAFGLFVGLLFWRTQVRKLTD